MARVRLVGERAEAYHRGGLHCAEAVALAVVETYAPARGSELPRAASGFGGGVGRSHQDICGALAGAVLAVGLLLGRDQAGAPWQAAHEAAALLRRRFVAAHGSTNCGELLARFGPQENMARCHRLSGQTAALLAGILEEAGAGS
ncbi:MAG: C-GCAxxG-C-C family protein [Deltaproteobacteria bacterium]|nr:C-GCAxxG-C-C family protein [Deltaproteobacteria bacterium]